MRNFSCSVAPSVSVLQLDVFLLQMQFENRYLRNLYLNLNNLNRFSLCKLFILFVVHVFVLLPLKCVLVDSVYEYGLIYLRFLFVQIRKQNW
jgi:hypothetical protein